MSEMPSPPKRMPSALALMMLAIAIGGFVYAILGVIGLQEAQIPSEWQSINGQILERGVDVEQVSKSNGDQIELFKPKVRYRYEVDSQFYIGERLSRHHPGRTLRGVAETEVEDLPQGTNVTVHYDPANPSEAVLRKSDTIGAIQAISAGLAIGLTSFAIFIISVWRQRRSSGAET